MFVRFGDLPASGLSYNAETDEPELGVSVYEAEMADGIVTLHLREIGEWAAVNMFLRERPLFLIDGELVGTGGDGEPVLTNATATPLAADDIAFVIES